MPKKNCDSAILDPAAGTAPGITEVRRQESLLRTGALQNAIFNSIFNSANFSSIATDAKGVIQIFNVGAERMLGYAAADVMNKITPADISDPKEVIARAKALSVELGTPITPGFEALVFKASRGIEDIYELTYIRKDGSRFPAVVLVTALRDDQGAIIGYLLIGTDNTARKQAEEALRESENKYRLLIDNASESIVVVQDGLLKFVNLITLDLLGGYSEQELINRPFSEFIHPDDRSMVVENYRRRMTNDAEQLPRYAFRMVTRDGIVKWVEINATLIEWQGKPATLNFLAEITERKQAEEETQRERAFFDRLVETAPEGIAIADPQGRVMRVNAEFVRMFGYGADEAVGQYLDDLVAPPARQEEARAITRSTGKGETELLETVRRRKDATLVDVSLIGAPILVAGKLEAVYGIYRDITERKQAEEESQRERAFFDRLVESAPEGIAITNTQGRIMRVNAEFVRMFGYGVDEAVGQFLDDLVAPPARQEEARALTASIAQGREILLETVRRRKDGTLVDVSLIGTPILIAGKQVALYDIYRDITGRKQAEQKLEEMATHDFLTGLPNRRLLLDRFTIAAALAHRNKDRIAVMSLDLDNFKSINDTFGHDAGDQVLKVISTRLVRILRASDTFARVGGDEFISVMMETDHIEGATAIAQKILDSFTEPLSIAGHQLHLSTSIGLAIYPEDGEDLETLTKKSDAAMYYSKSHGRNQFKFYGDDDVQIGRDYKS